MTNLLDSKATWSNLIDVRGSGPVMRKLGYAIAEAKR